MTDKQAQVKARLRWGKEGVAAEMLGPIFRRYEVGVGRDSLTGGAAEVKGVGKTWEEAFEKAQA